MNPCFYKILLSFQALLNKILAEWQADEIIAPITLKLDKNENNFQIIDI